MVPAMPVRHAPTPALGTDTCCPGSPGDLLDATEANRLAATFKALSDPTRLRLLRYLAESASGTACACHLPDALGISQPTLSFHMSKLHRAGLVDRTKIGRWVHWTIRGDALAATRAFLDLEGAPGPCC
jgi:ArsR family transcriptional regulator